MALVVANMNRVSPYMGTKEDLSTPDGVGYSRPESGKIL